MFSGWGGNFSFVQTCTDHPFLPQFAHPGFERLIHANINRLAQRSATTRNVFNLDAQILNCIDCWFYQPGQCTASRFCWSINASPFCPSMHCLGMYIYITWIRDEFISFNLTIWSSFKDKQWGKYAPTCQHGHGTSYPFCVACWLSNVNCALSHWLRCFLCIKCERNRRLIHIKDEVLMIIALEKSWTDCLHIVKGHPWSLTRELLAFMCSHPVHKTVLLYPPLYTLIPCQH